jgi:hypothetical protein
MGLLGNLSCAQAAELSNAGAVKLANTPAMPCNDARRLMPVCDVSVWADDVGLVLLFM